MCSAHPLRLYKVDRDDWLLWKEQLENCSTPFMEKSFCDLWNRYSRKHSQVLSFDCSSEKDTLITDSLSWWWCQRLGKHAAPTICKNILCHSFCAMWERTNNSTLLNPPLIAKNINRRSWSFVLCSRFRNYHPSASSSNRKNFLINLFGRKSKAWKRLAQNDFTNMKIDVFYWSRSTGAPV